MPVIAETLKEYKLEHGERMNIAATNPAAVEVSLDGVQWVPFPLANPTPAANVLNFGKCLVRFSDVGVPASQFEIGPTEM